MLMSNKATVGTTDWLRRTSFHSDLSDYTDFVNATLRVIYCRFQTAQRHGPSKKAAHKAAFYTAQMA